MKATDRLLWNLAAHQKTERSTVRFTFTVCCKL